MPKYWKRIVLYAILSGIFIGVLGTEMGLGTEPRFFLNLLSGFIIGVYYARKERAEQLNRQS